MISTNDPSAHAEIIALKNAGAKLNNYRLIDCTLYCTLEPCLMCASAMVHARIKTLVYASNDYKTGAIHSACKSLEYPFHNHKIEVRSNILSSQCSELLSDFFKQRRADKLK